MPLFIPIVNVKHARGKIAFHYVGRDFAGLPGHELGNPFSVQEYGLRECLERYDKWLATLTGRDEALRRIVADTECGRIPLACWCGERLTKYEPRIQCHAQIIADWVVRIFPELKSIEEVMW